MKIIAVIEDTGERRKALPGEKWTSPYQLAGLNVAHSVYTHEQSGTDEQVILRVTEGPELDSEVQLSLRDRIELIHLRKFAKLIKEASASLSAHGIDSPDELLREAELISTRMQVDGVLLRYALKEFAGREDEDGILGRKGLAVDYPTPAQEPNWRISPTPPPFVPQPIPIAPVAVADPFETEETSF